MATLTNTAAALPASALRWMGKNPFLLTMLCWVAERYRIPADITRTELYDLFIPDLLGLPQGGGTPDRGRGEELVELLAPIALEWFLETNYDRAFPSKILRERLKQQAKELIMELAKKRVLVPVDASRSGYIFAHRSIVEYLAACELARLLESSDRYAWKIADHKAWDPKWRLVLVFLAGRLMSEPYLPSLRSPNAELFRKLLELLSDREKDDDYRHRLAVAVECLGEGPRARRGEFEPLVDRITAEAWDFWCGHEQGGTGAAVQHLTKVLPVLGKVNGKVDATPLLELIAEDLKGLSGSTPTPLTPQPEDARRQAVLTAVKAMGAAAATPEYVARLGELLRDGDWEVLDSVVEAIGALGAAAATPEIIARLGELLLDGDWEMQERAEALKALGAAATPEFLVRLGELLDDQHEYVRRSAAWKVSALGALVATPEIIARLGEMLRDKDDDVRQSAANAVGALGAAAATPEIVARLGELLRDGYWKVRHGAAEAIGAMGAAAAPPEIVAQLGELLRDEDDYVRQGAANAVGALGAAAATPEIVARLGELLRDGHWEVRRSAPFAIKALGAAAATPEIIARLDELLRDKDDYVRDSAAWAVGVLRAATPEFIARLAELLRDENEYVRQGAANAVGALGAAAATPEIVARLGELLLNEDRHVWSSAICAAGALGPEAATPEIVARLRELLRDEDWGVRFSAAWAVGGLGTAAATPEIIARLGELLLDGNEDVRRCATGAVGALGVAAATPEIIARLGELLRDEYTRSSTANALAALFESGIRVFGLSQSCPKIYRIKDLAAP